MQKNANIIYTDSGISEMYSTKYDTNSCNETVSSMDSNSKDGFQHIDPTYTITSDSNISNTISRELHEQIIAKSGKKFIKDRNLFITIRNARERYRVFQINAAFARLRQVIPYTAYRKKRISKVKTLTKALQYISELEIILGIQK